LARPPVRSSTSLIVGRQGVSGEAGRAAEGRACHRTGSPLNIDSRQSP
jgi:hypothetical protein